MWCLKTAFHGILFLTTEVDHSGSRWFHPTIGQYIIILDSQTLSVYKCCRWVVKQVVLLLGILMVYHPQPCFSIVYAAFQ